MSILIDRGNWSLYVGRDYMLDLDAKVSLAWNRRSLPIPEGECLFEDEISISWNWWPQVYRWYDTPPRFHNLVSRIFDSRLWTGKVYSFRRMRWRFNYYRRVV